MAKQLNMSINITANADQAKREMKALQDQLGRLGKGIDYGSGIGTSFTKGIQTATKDLAQLQLLLRQTVNTDTGKLDFAKFNDGLKKSGRTLEDYSKTLVSLGPEGQQAFLKLSNAVAQSEIPIIRVSNLFKQLGTTLANTARWQISSSVLHGFMGSIQSAYGYAQDLNRSLNDIRIVTGYSANEMARFAETANKAAQSLSTTTTAYTDAALIFYQQGLSDEQVKARTDATIKMANVTGENAEHVSSYMTAIWNNFDDGSKSLEYYADVMTKLGAATAASSEEIAEGMEKFAAVGNTVGLSYEYAAAAVTTVIDKTRQSADIVGTSFKTIFARLEGLQLGETLEDGTTLNKYSKALASVGVDIKDQNGELKQMDQILDELGAKWETLNKDQQVALAQTVGGVRQYTQLIALMENFDAFRENIRLGLGSEGTLQEQQNIYAQSWEASAKRVRAAWEALYTDLLNDDWFIWLNDELAKFLKQLDRIIDRMGGLKGILIQIAPILTNIFSEQITKGIGNLRLNALTLTRSGRNKVEDERAKEIERATKGVKSIFGEDSIEAAQYESRLKANTELAKITHKLNEEQKLTVKFAQDASDAAWEQAKAEDAKLEKMKEELDLKNKILTSPNKEDFKTKILNSGYLEEESKNAINDAFDEASKYTGMAQLAINPKGASIAQLTGNLESLAGYASNYNLTLTKEYREKFDELEQALKNSNGEVTEEVKEKAENFLRELGDQADTFYTALLKTIEEQVAKSYEFSKKDIHSKYNSEIEKLTENPEGRPLWITSERAASVESARQTIADIESGKLFSESDDKLRKKLIEAYQKVIELRKKEAQEIQELNETQKDLTDELTQDVGASNIQDSDIKAQEQKAMMARANAEKVLPEAMKELREQDEKRMPNLEEKFMAYTQAATSFLAVIDSITNVFDVWNSEASLGEKLKTTLQAVIMMSTQILALKKSDSIATLKKVLFTTADSKAMEDNTKATLKNADAKKKDAADTITNANAQGTETVAKNADTAASKGLLGRGPALSGAGIGFGIAAGVVATYIVAEKAWEKSYVEAINKRQAAAEARVEEAKAWKEEHAQQLEAVENYRKIAEGLDKATESREKYNETLLETAKALSVENAEVLAATKQYDLLQTAVDRAADSLEQQEQNKNLDIVNSTADSLYYGGVAVTGDFSNLLTGGIGAENYIGHGLVEEFGESQLLSDLADLGISGVSTRGGAISYDTSEMTSEDISRLMHFFADVQANPGKYGGDSNELIKGINKINDNFAEAVAQFDASVQDFRKSEIDFAFEAAGNHEGNWVSAALSGASGFTTGNGNSFDFSSMADIESIRNSMIKAFAELFDLALDDPTVIEAVDRNLANILGEAFQSERVLDTFAQLNGFNTTKLKEIYDEQSDSTQEVIMQAIGKNATLTAGLIRTAGENIEEVIDDIEVIANSIDISEFEKSFRTIQATLDSLKFGDVLDPEKIAELATNLGFDSVEELMENYGNYFTELSDGVYQMTGRVEDLSEEMNASLLKRLEDRKETQQYLDNTEELINSLAEQKKAAQSNANLYYRQDPEKALQGLQSKVDEIQTLANQLTSGNISELFGLDDGIHESMVAKTGISSLEEYNNLISQISEIEDYIQLIEAADAEIAELSEEQQRYLDYQNGNKTAFEDILVTEYTTLEELQDLYEEGWITAEKYYKSLRSAAIQEAKALGINIEELEEYAHYLEVNNEALQGDANAAMDVALAHMRLQEGLKDLNSNFNKYNEILHSTEEDSIEYGDAISSIEKDLQHLFNTDEAIDAKFITDNLELIEQAAQGDLEAITDLQLAFALASTDAEGAFAKAGQDLELFKAQIDELEWDGIEIGASIDTNDMLNDWFNTMNDMVKAEQMSAETMQAIWNSLGFELEPETASMDILPNGVTTLQGMPAGLARRLGVTTVEAVTGFKGANYTGSNKAAAGVSRSSGGSGGGGKSSQKEQKEEEERYYVVSRLLKDQQDQLDRLDKAKNRAYGKAHLDLINQEAAALEREKEINDQYLKEIESYLASDRAKVAGMGAQFDENGIITNYEQLLKQYVDQYNAAVASGDEAAIAMYEKQLEDFKNFAAKYDETRNLWIQKQDEITEELRAIYDKELEGIQYTLQVKVELNDDSLKILQYQFQHLQDIPFSTAEQLVNKNQQVQLAMNRGNYYRTAAESIIGGHGKNVTIDQVAGMSNEELANLGYTTEEIAELRSDIENMLSSGNTVSDLAKQIVSGPLEAFKEWNAEFEYQNQIIAHNSKLLQSYINIGKLGYSNIPGMNDDFISGLMRNSFDTGVASTQALKEELEAKKKAYNDYYESVKNMMDDEVAGKQIRENLREMQKDIQTTEENVLASIESTMQQAQAIFEDSLEKAKKTFQQATATDDWSMTLFERQKEMDDMYLDDYEKIYEFSKLTRDVNNSINNTQTIRDRERLLEVTEEIAQLEREGAEVSQYQVDALRAKYELRLAEIALEDAQNAKSTVRMQRDNEGNWSYVYTAEQDKVDEARQNYEDKLYEYQKLNSDFIKEQQTNFLNMEKKYQEEVEKIAKDAFLSEDEKRQRIQETTEYYEQLGYNMNDQLLIAIGKNKELYDKDWKWYHDNFDYKISAEKDYITTFENTYLGPLGDLYKNFKDAMVGEEGYVTLVDEAIKQFGEDQRLAMQAGGITDYINQVKGAADGAMQSTSDAAKQVHTDTGNMVTDIGNVIDKMKELYGLNASNFVTQMGEAAGAVTQFIEKWSKVNNVELPNPSSPPSGGSVDPLSPSAPGGGSGSGGSGGGGVYTSNKDLETESKKEKGETDFNGKAQALANAIVSIYNKANPRDRGSVLKLRTRLLNEVLLNPETGERILPLMDRADKYYQRIASGQIPRDKLNYVVDQILKYYSDDLKFKPSRFDTGGYTGSWGTSGRLAFLHQKELVLNAQDTENMLKMTEYVRDLAQMVDLRAAADSMARVDGMGSAMTAAQAIEQNVRIEASFPNVTSSSEIEEAFNNLVNRAAQYASRTKY